MVPGDLALIFDFYLCVTCKNYLEQRIWKAQPKIQHKRKNDDESEEPVKTEIIETEASKEDY